MVERGKVSGSATNKVRAAMERAGIAYTIELLPWKRAYTVAPRRADACNRAVPDPVIARLNEAVRDIARDGTARRIERQYEP